MLAQIVRSTTDFYLATLSPYAAPATLPHLAFESATKKTRPVLSAGALVYARVALADRHMDPELECVVGAAGGRAEGLGPITGPGCAFDVSLGFARRLLMARSREEGGIGVLEMLAGEDDELATQGGGGGGLAFETAVGRNGRVWVGSEDPRTVVIVGRALQETDRRGLDLDGQRKLVRRLLREMR